MKLLLSALVYTSLALGANAADLAGLREGSLKKLNFHSVSKPVPDASFTTADGAEVTLADWRGKVVLVNFWATWCAPCRKEMPALDALNAEFGGDGFEVVTIATGRNALPAIRNFFEDAGIETLPILLDPRQAMARQMAVLGLPASILIDADGREIARMTGDADWASDSAKAIVSALLAGG